MLPIPRCFRAVFVQVTRWMGRLAVGRPASSRSNEHILDDVEAGLASMPLFVREAYLLRQVDKLNHAQIAKTLGVSEKEVQRLLRDAVRILDRSTNDPRAGP